VELAGPAIGHVGVKKGLAGWVGGLGFSPKPYREWKIFYVFFQILFIISNPFVLNSKLNVKQFLFAIYIMLKHTSVQMEICNDMNATKQLFL
jgi:hypothetical protein